MAHAHHDTWATPIKVEHDNIPTSSSVTLRCGGMHVCMSIAERDQLITDLQATKEAVPVDAEVAA
jgi:hypothetical protein